MGEPPRCKDVVLGFVGQGRGCSHAHALRGVALRDWGQGRGGRRCAWAAAACPAGSAPAAHELDPATTRNLLAGVWELRS
jgi:hypothetical protein